MLLLAATEDDIDIDGDPEQIWRPRVSGELRSGEINSGHRQAEQAPGELAKALTDFLISLRLSGESTSHRPSRCAPLGA